MYIIIIDEDLWCMLLRCILLDDINFYKLVIVGILWEEIRGWGEVEWVEWSGF